MWSFKEVFAMKNCQFRPLPYIYGENTVFSQCADYLVLTGGGLGHEKNVDMRLSSKIFDCCDLFTVLSCAKLCYNDLSSQTASVHQLLFTCLPATRLSATG